MYSDMDFAEPVTTITFLGIPAHHSQETFQQLLDMWGLIGTYNYFFMPHDGSKAARLGGASAVVNFIDPSFAELCQALFNQTPSEGVARPARGQGLEFCSALWSQYKSEGTVHAPIYLPTMAMDMAPEGPEGHAGTLDMAAAGKSKRSPQVREQFIKTRMCAFFKKKKCALGSACPFAHTKIELLPGPDLSKTKMCYNFSRHRCQDQECKFAHGYRELRATTAVLKTEFCPYWVSGTCKAGKACRFAHAVEELRVPEPWIAPAAGSWCNDFMVESGYANGEASTTAEDGGAADNRQFANGSSAEGQPRLRAPRSRGGRRRRKGGAAVGEEAGEEAEALAEQAVAFDPIGTAFDPIGFFRDDNFVLRVTNTFVEVVDMDAQDDSPLHRTRRSLSCGDLPSFDPLGLMADDE